MSSIGRLTCETWAGAPALPRYRNRTDLAWVEEFPSIRLDGLPARLGSHTAASGVSASSQLLRWDFQGDREIRNAESIRHWHGARTKTRPWAYSSNRSDDAPDSPHPLSEEVKSGDCRDEGVSDGCRQSSLRKAGVSANG